MRTNTPTHPVRLPPKKRRSRFGYDRLWRGEEAGGEGEHVSYWAATRRPLPCLLFVAPILLAYEVGILWLGGTSAEALRTGADAWMRQGLVAVGVSNHWFLPLSLVLALAVWQVMDRPCEWRVPPAVLLGMALESLVLAVALVGLSRLVDLGMTRLERPGAPFLATGGAAPDPSTAALIGFLGAGVYEEALFRLILVPLLFLTLRGLQTPTVLASALAVTASSLLFSLAHHAGMPGEPFTWFAFIFRWLAGVYFAWVFVGRGFGVAVGTHTAYDLMVGWLGWHF